MAQGGNDCTMMKRIFILISCFMLFTGSTWDAERTQQPKTLYENQGGVKWETQPSDKAEVDQPDPGWFRDPSSYPVPDSWPEWAKRRFQKISYSNGSLEPFRKEMMWDKPALDVNTKWIDALADKSKGAIEVQVSSFSHFTFIVLDPPQGIVDQDFQGNAKVYGLDDTKQYRIVAFDARGFLGMAVTAISDKYVRALPDSTDNFGTVRNPVMAQKVVEDPNRDLWASVYQPEWTGATYRFIDIYSIDPMGKVKASFEVPLYTSYIRPWLSDLILETNGDVTFSTCEDPMGLSSYLGPSWISRLEKSGATVWTTPTDEIGSSICIAPLQDGGYVYGGATFSADPLELDKQFGIIARLDSTGGHTNFGVSGTTYVVLDYSVRDIKRSDEEYTYNKGLSGELTDTVGGSCSDTFRLGSCADAFDENDATYVYDLSQFPDWQHDGSVTWDFGTAQNSTSISVLVSANIGTHDIYVEGSNDGVSYNTIFMEVYNYTSGWVTLSQDNNVTYRYYRARFRAWSSYSDMEQMVAEFNIYGVLYSGTGTDNHHYVVGRYNTGGPRLFSAIQTAGCPSSAYSYNEAASDTECCSAMDANFIGTDFAGEGNCMVALVGCGWNNGSQSAVKSKVWYRLNVASTITLQYFDGSWQTISSVAGTADGSIHLWEVDFAEITASNWRVTFSTSGGAPCDPYLQEWQLYPESTGGGTIAKYVLSGVTGGTEVWQTKYMNTESLAGIFNAMSISIRDPNVIIGVGSTEHSTVNLGLNKGMAMRVDASGTSIWVKDYTQASEWYDIQPTEDGGFLLAGTLYTGTSVQARSAVIMKIDKDGNVDPKFPQEFKETVELGADGRGVIETRDKGYLMVGGSSDAIGNRSKPYFMKGDRFYRSCSHGDLCR